MTDFVGVVPGLNSFLEMDDLKTFALMFDRLCIPHARGYILQGRKLDNRASERIAEVEWLLDKGIVFEATDEDLIGNQRSDLELSDLEANTLHDLIEIRWCYAMDQDDFTDLMKDPQTKCDLDRFFELARIVKQNGADDQTVKEMYAIEARSPFFEFQRKQLVAMFEDSFYETRWVAARLRRLRRLDAFPVTRLGNDSGDDFGRKSDVVKVSIAALPLPDDSVPWEQILEYKQDPQTKQHFTDFRFWLSEVTRSELNSSEVTERLEFLIHQYNKQIRLHKMKTQVGTLEAVVVAGAEFLENLAKLNWTKIARGLFAMRHQRIALLEAELNAPGNEIAYVVKTHERFSPNG